MSLYLQICQSCLPVEDKTVPDDAACMNLQIALQTAGFEARIVSAPCLGVCLQNISWAGKPAMYVEQVK